MNIEKMVEQLENMSDSALMETLEILIREMRPELNTRQVKTAAQEKLVRIREALKRRRRADDDGNNGREFIYKEAETDDGTNSGAVGGVGGVVYTFQFDVDVLDETELLVRLFAIAQDVIEREAKRARRSRSLASIAFGISATTEPGGVQLGD